MVKRKTTYAQEIKAMAKIAGHDIFPSVHLPKQPADKSPKKPRSRRIKYDTDGNVSGFCNDMREKEVERKLLWWLNMQPHIIAWKSGEQATYNAQHILPGVADITAIDTRSGKVFFVEVKSDGGVWRESQIAFAGMCWGCGIGYILARSPADLAGIIG